MSTQADEYELLNEWFSTVSFDKPSTSELPSVTWDDDDD